MGSANLNHNLFCNAQLYLSQSVLFLLSIVPLTALISCFDLAGTKSPTEYRFLGYL